MTAATLPLRLSSLSLRRDIRERAGRSLHAQGAASYLRFVLREIAMRGETPARLLDLRAAQVNYERAVAR